MKTNHVAIEENHVTHNQGRLIVNHNTAKDWLRAIFGDASPVMAKAFRWKKEAAIEIVDVKQVAFVSYESIVFQLLI